MNELAPNKPRPLAIAAFGAGDVFLGATKLTNYTSQGTASLYGPIWAYGLVFVLLGVSIWVGYTSRRVMYLATMAALFVWSLYAVQIALATIWQFAGGSLVIGGLHIVLFPYWRKSNY